MKKIILNKCYGGFDVSDEAYRLYAKRKGLELFCYKPDFSQKSMKYIKIDTASNIFDFYVTKDLGESTTSKVINDYHLMLEHGHRDDETLIDIVEELGEKASGPYGKLVVVEVPDDVAEDYIIDNYDGIETLHKRVQVW